MNEHMTFIAVQPVQAKAETSTRASALETCVSERAEATTRAWTGWWR